MLHRQSKCSLVNRSSNIITQEHHFRHFSNTCFHRKYYFVWLFLIFTTMMFSESINWNISYTDWICFLFPTYKLLLWQIRLILVNVMTSRLVLYGHRLYRSVWNHSSFIKHDILKYLVWLRFSFIQYKHLIIFQIFSIITFSNIFSILFIIDVLIWLY